jgi:hypothetical protein
MDNQMIKKSNNRVVLTLLLVAMLALVAVLAAFWFINVNEQQFPSFQQRRTPPPNFIPGDLEYFYAAFTIISTLNIALLVLLLSVYFDIYRKTRSPFTIGLVIFAAAFLVKDLTSSPLVISLLGFRAYGLGPFEFLPGLLEFFALTVLLYLSIKY